MEENSNARYSIMFKHQPNQLIIRRTLYQILEVTFHSLESRKYMLAVINEMKTTIPSPLVLQPSSLPPNCFQTK